MESIKKFLLEKSKDIRYILGSITVVMILALFIVLSVENNTYSKKIEKEQRVAAQKLKLDKEKAEKEKILKDIGYPAEEIRDYITGIKEYNGEKLVFLTFDNSIDTDSTEQILKILKDNNAYATFFIQGNTISDKTSKILKNIEKENNGIGMNSYSNDFSKLYKDEQGNTKVLMEEYRQTDEAIKKYLGKNYKSKTWRYPGGHMYWGGLEETDTKLEEKGVSWIDWNMTNGDNTDDGLQPTNKKEMLEYVENSYLQAGSPDISVVLMHDGIDKKLTIETLPEIIEFYRTNGYKFCIFN